MDEKRKHDRKRSSGYVAVIDIKTDEHLGCLVDLTLEGMRLMTKKQYEPSTISSFILDAGKKRKV